MSVQQLLLGASGASGYNIDKSLRFRASASANLSRTFGSLTARTNQTVSLWFKIGTLSTDRVLYAGYDGSSGDATSIILKSDNTLDFVFGGGAAYNLRTSQVFRDPSAWYHLVIAYDTTQATASNRVKMYINGVQVTAFSAANYPVLNATSQFSYTNGNNKISSQWNSTNFFDGYMAEFYFIDGQALTPASFGETNALTGVWQPKAYTGTYGTNGFYLDFEDTSSVAALGTDKSGNGNTWTVNNVSLTAGVTYDSMTDVPTLTSASAANYAVLNPLDKASTISTAQGNLYATTSTSVTNQQIRASIALPSSGKFYWETKNTGSVNNFSMGLTTLTASLTTEGAGDMFYNEGGVIGNNGSNTSGFATLALNDIVGVAVDVDDNKIYWYKNNTLVNSGGTTINITAPFAPMFGLYNNNNAQNVNFGQQPFAYTPPTGFVALNTFNLPTSTIVKGNTVMDATLYTGNGSTQTITNAAGFQPDLVWIKNRNNTRWHILTDSVRGTNSQLFSNDTSAQEARTDRLTAFNSNGFSVGSYTDVNLNADTFVAWQWQANGAAVSNTSGTITSQVSVNASAGFSVATYTGNGTAGATVGHGLGVAPKLVIVKKRNGIQEWMVGSSSLTSWNNYLLLNTSGAQAGATTIWNDTAPTSSVFSLGSSTNTNGNTNTFVAYCWSEIDGFSKFGSYTGNGSADGPFIYLGFRPKFLLYKRTASAGSWGILDSARNPNNPTGKYLYPNASDAEFNGDSAYPFDFLSNGFKIRHTGASENASGSTYIYAAFAENPFKNSLAE